MKILAVLLGSMILAQFSLVLEAGAIKAGPYDVTVDLPGFDKVNVVGPLNSEVQNGANGATTYWLSLKNGNEYGHELVIGITKYNMPLSDFDKQLDGYYGDAFRNAYPAGYWDEFNDIMIDGCIGRHGHEYNKNHDYICYFKNRNTEVEVDCRNLSPDEYSRVLESLSIEGA